MKIIVVEDVPAVEGSIPYLASPKKFEKKNSVRWFHHNGYSEPTGVSTLKDWLVFYLAHRLAFQLISGHFKKYENSHPCMKLKT